MKPPSIVHGLKRGFRKAQFWEGVEACFVDHGGEPDVVIAGLGRMPRQSYLNRLKRGKPPKRRRL